MNISASHSHPKNDPMHVHHAKCNQGCAEDSHGPTKFDQLMQILEKVSAFALGIFAACTNINLFIPFFLIGLMIGVHVYYAEPSHQGNHKHISSCSQGFMEQLTGIKLPAPLSLAANVAITICHIDHHDTVFVPIIGATIGAWTGKTMMQAGGLLSTKIDELNTTKKSQVNLEQVVIQ